MTRICVSQKGWEAIVTFFKSEEQIMIDSLGIPGREKETWLAELRQADPSGYRIYEDARKAIASARKVESR